MAARIRADGRILCAAMHAAEPGDLYLHDGIHGMLIRSGALVTEPMHQDIGRFGGRGGHAAHGEWWWRTDVPENVVLEDRELELPDAVRYVGPGEDWRAP